jgi:hypothetical protein
MALYAVEVDCEFGRYAVRPDRIQEIRFVDTPASGGPVSGPDGFTRPGSVVTTTGQEISGSVHTPDNWVMQTDLGPLTLAPANLRSIALVTPPPSTALAPDPKPPGEPVAAAPSSSPAAPTDREPDASRSRRLGPLSWAVFHDGAKVVVRNNQTAKAGALDLPATEKAPIDVRPVVVGELLALHLEGAQVARVAALDVPAAQWYAQDLREPFSGALDPIVGPAVVIYTAGRRVYAFGAPAHRWGVLELPEGARPNPVLTGDGATVEADGAVHTFDPKTAEWRRTEAAKPAQIASPAADPRPR